MPSDHDCKTPNRNTRRGGRNPCRNDWPTHLPRIPNGASRVTVTTLVASRPSSNLNWFVGGDHGTYHRPRRSPLSSTLAPNIVPRQHHSGIPTSCKDLD